MLTRAALRTTARVLRQQPIQLQKQQPFSIMHNLRTFARSFEPHPFQRLPVTSQSAAADWGKLVKRASTQAVVYVSSLPPLRTYLKDRG